MLICVARYRRALKSQLHCVGKTHRELIKQFDKSLEVFLQDHPDTTEAELYTAFGTPENMALSIMSHVSQEEKDRYRRRKMLVRGVLGLAAVVLLLFSLYVFCIKHFSVIEFHDEVFQNTRPTEVLP